jgi:hypothetical protein
VIPWEEAFPEVKEKHRAIAQAAINASPELTEARATIGELREQLAKLTGGVATDAARAFLAAPVAYADAPEASTVGELLAGILLDEWQTAPRFTPGKTAVYLAAVRAGLIPGVAAGDRIGELDVAAAEALTEAAIRAMGQPAAEREVAAALRSMIARKQEAIDTAGTGRGLGPTWHEATFTAREILAAICGAGGGS